MWVIFGFKLQLECDENVVYYFIDISIMFRYHECNHVNFKPLENHAENTISLQTKFKYSEMEIKKWAITKNTKTKLTPKDICKEYIFFDCEGTWLC